MPEPKRRCRTTTYINLSDLQTLVDNSIDDFLSLSDVLHLRGCTQALFKQYHPIRSPQLWLRIKPPLRVYSRAVAVMTAKGACLFEGLYLEAAANEFREYLRKVACVVGNFELVRWCHTRPALGGLVSEDSLLALCEHGHLEIAAWVATNTRDSGLDQLWHHQYLRTAARAGDTKMAKWLLDGGYMPEASGYELMALACQHDNIEFAAWVLNTFPIGASSSMLCEILRPAGYVQHYTPPRAIRWLIETFDLSWTDIRPIYLPLLSSLDSDNGEPENGDYPNPGCSHPAYRSVYNWLIARYYKDWLDEYNRSSDTIKDCRFHQTAQMRHGYWLTGPSEGYPMDPPTA